MAGQAGRWAGERGSVGKSAGGEIGGRQQTRTTPPRTAQTVPSRTARHCTHRKVDWVLEVVLSPLSLPPLQAVGGLGPLQAGAGLMGPGQGEATDQSSELSQRAHALTLLHPARAPVSPQAKQAGRQAQHA